MKIKDTKKKYKKVLSYNNSKDVWKIIYGISKPHNAILNTNIYKLNKFFNTTTKRITDANPNMLHELFNQKPITK